MADTHPGPEAPERPRPARSAADQAGAGQVRATADFHTAVADVMVALALEVSTTLALEPALARVAAEANRLLDARRTSIWLHQRRARVLSLAASSDVASTQTAAVVPSDDTSTPAARGLRLQQAAFDVEGSTIRCLAPLRGWRRALGTLVVERLAPGHQSEELDRVQDLARQLSAALESLQLLEDVLQQRQLLENTFDSIVDLVAVLDPAMRVVQANDALAARTGLSRPELLDRPLEAIVGPELAAWAAAQAGGEDAATGVTRRIDDDRLSGTFAVTMTPLGRRGGRPAGRVLVARDITDAVRLEREREALRDQLVQSERLASLGQFVAGIAHELNNPLQGVLGHLELLIETEEAARPLRRELRRIFHEADRAAKIVRNLLVFSGARRMARKRVRMSRLISRVLVSRTSALETQGITVVRTEAPDVPPVAGDPLLLHQALLNILLNAEQAILATGRPGQIEIAVDAPPGTDAVRVTVRDTGDGIPTDVLGRIFDPFFTTKDVGQGTGLGLALTYGIVQEHGGGICAANAPEGGAVFTLELPAAE